MKRRIRRKLRRQTVPVRRQPEARGGASREGAPREGDSGLMVGGAHDPAEHAADRMAARVLSGAAATGAATGGGALHRQATAPVVAPGASAAPAPKHAAKAVSELGSGRALSASERGYFEPRLGTDLSPVRLHEGAAADRASRTLDARAFTIGHDVAFAKGAATPQTMAHELSHVAMEAPKTLRRDLAVEPATPDAAVAVLTPAERRAAQRFNERRFEDPFTISVVRDVMGVSKFPAQIDDDFIDGLVRWQASHGLTQDGQFGPASTRTFLAELGAEGMANLVTQLRSDNSVQVNTTFGPQFPAAPGGAAGTPFVGFDWDVAFRTSLRTGFVVQHIQSTWAENPASPSGVAAPVLDYWEAWGVDANGRITNPKHPSGGDDKWRRIMHNNTRGAWTMAGTLFTVLNLPAQFNAPGGANHVPDSGGLRSALNLSAANIDALGLPEGFAAIQAGDERARRIGGAWDFTNANAALNFNRRA